MASPWQGPPPAPSLILQPHPHQRLLHRYPVLGNVTPMTLAFTRSITGDGAVKTVDMVLKKHMLYVKPCTRATLHEWC